MKIKTTKINDVLLIKPTVFRDERGFFFESWNDRTFTKEVGINALFCQENHSHSNKNVLRGLGYQIYKPQAKLVRVTKGAILDVAVDLRRNSSTFGCWYSVELTEKNHWCLWLPPGCAHGFLVKSRSADVVYMTTEYYTPEYERCIIWNDRTLGIEWDLKQYPILSPKDRLGISFDVAEVFEW